jgi:two-component system cell cycle sensor histidine kinase/response regulator CckA
MAARKPPAAGRPRRPRRAKAAPAPEQALASLWETPELWQSLFENSPDMVMIVDRRWQVAYVNRALPPFGHAQPVGSAVLDCLPAEHRGAAGELLERVFRTGVPAGREFAAAGPGAAPLLLETRVLPVVREGGVAAVLITGVDVTERRWAERLQHATRRIAEAALAAPSLHDLYPVIHRVVGELMPATNLYIALYDADADRISFPYFVDEVDQPPPPHRPWAGLTEYVLRTGTPLLGTPEVFADLVRRGEVEPLGAPSVDWLGVPLVADGKTFGVLVVQTYTEGVRYGEMEMNILKFVSTQIAMAIVRTRAADALRHSEERLLALESATTEAIALHEGGRVVEINGAFLRMFGYERHDEVVGRDVLDFAAPESHGRIIEAVQAGREEPYEAEGVRRDGVRFTLELAARMTPYRGRLVRMVAIRDVTARRRAEEALRESERQLRAVINNAPIVFFAWDAEGRFVLSEGKGLEALGLTSGQVVGQSVFEVYRDHPAVLESARRALAGEAFNAPVEIGALHFDVWYSPVHDEHGALSGVIGVATDVTAKEVLEAQLRQAVKMEAVGRLAGGIAHDFNNLLTAILSYADFLLTSLGVDHPAREDAEEVRRAALKAADLTRQLLAFSRRQVLQPKLLDVNAIVVEMEKLLRRLIGEDVTLRTSLAGGLGVVRADPSQLEQVIVNLAVNARDAMPRGGTLTIETADADADDVRAHGRVTVPSGRYVMLRMSDTGEGMDAATRARLFEPFFTTKEHGRGTGLGLATVYGIVKQSGGFIWVDSAEGRGTTFTVHLPRAEAAGAPAAAPTPRRDARAGGETILLVEDDEAVRDLTRRTLVGQGYRVLEAANGTEALRLAAEHQGPLDLLLTDIVMPGIGGRALAETLGASRPGTAVLFVSGYTEDEVIRKGAEVANLPFLQKPFSPATLLGRVRDVLDARP